MDALKTLVGDAREWVDSMVKKQAGLKQWEDPVLLAKDLERRIKDVGREVEKLAQKKAPRRSKVSSSAKAETKTASDEPPVETPAAEGDRIKDEL